MQSTSGPFGAFFIGLALLLFPAIACAQAGSADATCQEILANRNSHGVIVHLYGDSIMRGKALGAFEDGDGALDPANPLYAFRSPASMANMALEANGRPERFAYCGGVVASTLAARVASGVIRAGDTVILEDAGSYAAGPNSYYSWWWSALQALNVAGVTVVMESQYDYCFANNMICTHPDMQYDAQMMGQGTLNDATRRAFATTLNSVNASGNVYAHTRRFIDANWIMDSWRNSAASVDGVEVMLGDGCHPNVWGQMKLVQHYLAVAGLRSYVTTTTTLEDLAEANYQTLAYGSTAFTASRARAYVAAMLRAN